MRRIYVFLLCTFILVLSMAIFSCMSLNVSAEEELSQEKIDNFPEGYMSLEEAREMVLDIALNYGESIPIKFAVSMEDFEEPIDILNNLVASVYEHTGNPKGGDYAYLTIQIQSQLSTYESDGYYICEYEGCIDYKDTDEATEREVDKKIAEILRELNLDGLSKAEKVVAICEYISQNVQFDSSLNDASFTAHGAVLDGLAVGEGVSLMFYRLALASGVDCRLVYSGLLESVWNIVQLDDGKYYFVDAALNESILAIYALRGMDWWEINHRDPMTDCFDQGCILDTWQKVSEVYEIPKEDYYLVIHSEAFNNELTWTYDTKNVLRICLADGCSEAEIPDFTIDNMPSWRVSFDYSKLLIISEGITEIGDYAFYNNVHLENVILPTSLKRIGDYSFYANIRLEEADINSELEYIGEYAFFATVIKSFELPDSMKAIGKYAFSNVDSLQKLRIYGIDMVIGEYAFEGCYRLESVGPLGGDYNVEYCAPEYITKNSLRNFDYMKKLYIADGVLSIEDEALAELFYLKEVYVGNGLKYIGDRAFYNCYNLEKLYMSDTVISIGNEAFKLCASLTGTVCLGENLKDIGDWAFNGCNSNVVFECNHPMRPQGWSALWADTFSTTVEVIWSKTKGIKISGVSFSIGMNEYNRYCQYANFYYEADSECVDYSWIYVGWPSAETAVMEVTEDKGVVSCEIPLGGLNKGIKITASGIENAELAIISSDGQLLGRGDYWFEFSKYVDVILNGDYSAEIKDIVKALYDCDLCFQAYFNGTEGNDMDTFVSINNLEEYIPVISKNVNDEIEYIGSSLRIDGVGVFVRHYFIGDLSGYNIHSEDTWGIPVIKKGSVCYVEYHCGNVNNLGYMSTLSMTNGSKWINIKYSPLSYCYKVLANNKEGDIYNLVISLYNLHTAVQTLLGSESMAAQ